SFFFSSRRRHTRSKRDWSSDVCSSDLGQPVGDRGRVTVEPSCAVHGRGVGAWPRWGSVTHCFTHVGDDVPQCPFATDLEVHGIQAYGCMWPGSFGASPRHLGSRCPRFADGGEVQGYLLGEGCKGWRRHDLITPEDMGNIHSGWHPLLYQL